MIVLYVSSIAFSLPENSNNVFNVFDRGRRELFDPYDGRRNINNSREEKTLWVSKPQAKTNSLTGTHIHRQPNALSNYLVNIPTPKISTKTLQTVLTLQTITNPHPINRSIFHLLNGTTTNNPTSVTNKVTPEIISVLETSI